MRHVLTAGLMMAFGLIFTATLATVVQQFAMARPQPAEPFSIFEPMEPHAPSNGAADGKTDGGRAGGKDGAGGESKGVACSPSQPSFRLGSPWRARDKSTREPEMVPGPTVPAAKPSVRPIALPILF